MVIGPRRESGAAAAGAIGVALGSLALCRLTLLPDVAYWDTAEFQAVGPLLGTAHPTGFPSYVILGWLASIVLQPLGDPAFRMNLLSALLVAGSAGLTVLVVRRLTGSLLLGIGAGAGLALTPIVWRIGTRADPHALHLPLIVLLTLLLIAWERAHTRRATERHAGKPGVGESGGGRWLVAAAAVFGVALANHSLTILLAPPVGLYVLAVEPAILRHRRLIAACAAALAGTAALLYLELPLRAGILRAPLVYGAPDTWGGFWYIVLAEQFRGSIADPFGRLDTKLLDLARLLIGQFGVLAPLVPVAFVATARRLPRYALLSGFATAITLFFSASYVNAEISRYYLVPAFFAWTWLAILAAGALDQVRAIVGEPAPADEAGDTAGRHRPTVALTIATIGAALVLVTPSLAVLPARSAAVDASRDTNARQWLDEALEAFQPDAVVVSWWSYSTTLWYGQHIEGRRPDIDVVDDRTRLDRHLGEIRDVIDSALGTRPVYVLRASSEEIAEVGRRYRLEQLPGRIANIYRVVPGEPAP